MLETVPLLMRALREHIRLHRPADMTLPQFRTLGYLSHFPGVSLSEVADFLGLGLPSASKLIEQLLQRGLVHRQADCHDRRRVMLKLTQEGERALAITRADVQQALAVHLAELPPAECKAVQEAMTHLHTLFMTILERGKHRSVASREDEHDSNE